MEPGHETLRPLVLVCDDTEPIRRLMSVNLDLDGYEVIEVTDGGAALAFLGDPDNELPAVIILDSNMTPHDGWWTIERIREDQRLSGVPVIMVTAAIQEHDRLQAEQAGLDALIAKPFDPDRLVELVSGFATHGRAYATQP
jgi:CheY-like chemotaxis protein